jgi:hypothetical protein
MGFLTGTGDNAAVQGGGGRGDRGQAGPFDVTPGVTHAARAVSAWHRQSPTSTVG